MAKVPGADFTLYAVPPGKQTGKYQRHLDEVMPAPGPRYYVDAPCQEKRRTGRHTRSIPMCPINLSIAKEMSSSPALLETLNANPRDRDVNVMDTPAYSGHPLVLHAARYGQQPPLPLAFYRKIFHAQLRLCNFRHGRSQACLRAVVSRKAAFSCPQGQRMGGCCPMSRIPASCVLYHHHYHHHHSFSYYH